jgi:hypothetical protein
MEADTKPGWMTTEFWTSVATLGANLIGALVIIGKILPADAPELTKSITTGVVSLGAFLASAWTVVNYIKSRLEVKRAALALRAARLAVVDRRMPGGA